MRKAKQSLMIGAMCLVSGLTMNTTNAQNFEWAKAFGGTAFDAGSCISVDASGNVYTTGVFTGTVDFDPGDGTANLTTAGGNDIFVQKMNASGKFLWAKAFGGTSGDYGYSINVDAWGNVYTTGYFLKTADFDPGAGTTNLTAAGSRDIFVQKMDSSGNFLWAKAFGGTSYDRGQSISVDALGNVYTTGCFQGTADFDPGAETANLTAAGDYGVFVQKMDASGNYLWAKAFGGTSYDFLNFVYDGGKSISIDGSGNVYTTGFFGGTADFDPGPVTANLTAVGSDDIFVQKMDSSGNFLWAKAFGGTNSDYGYSISVDAAGNVYTTGAFLSTVDFDPGAGTVNLTSGVSQDIFVQKMDSSGNFLWAKAFGGTNIEYGYSISVDVSGNVYTTGLFEGTADFDPGAGMAFLTTTGTAVGFDIFVQKMDSSGNFLWAKAFGGTSYDVGISISVDASGNIYTTGHFGGTADFDPGAGTTNLNAANNYDIFVQKMSQGTATGIVEMVNDIQVSAYPNPSSGLVQISSGKPLSDVAIKVTDVQGKVVFSKQLDAVSNEQLHIEGSAGIYFLSVKTPKGQSVVKLIKE